MVAFNWLMNFRTNALTSIIPSPTARSAVTYIYIYIYNFNIVRRAFATQSFTCLQHDHQATDSLLLLFIYIIWVKLSKINCDAVVPVPVWEYQIKWSIVKHANPYKYGSRRCNLCLEEKMSILKSNKKNLLNKRSELFSSCRHTSYNSLAS